MYSKSLITSSVPVLRSYLHRSYHICVIYAVSMNRRKHSCVTPVDTVVAEEKCAAADGLDGLEQLSLGVNLGNLHCMAPWRRHDGHQFSSGLQEKTMMNKELHVEHFGDQFEGVNKRVSGKVKKIFHLGPTFYIMGLYPIIISFTSPPRHMC